jgi:prepilin-type N-terminal cleavage/methylation domain-containing protein
MKNYPWSFVVGRRPGKPEPGTDGVVSALPAYRHGRRGLRPKAGGFTLVELMVAMTIFLVIGGCAFTLFQQQVNSSMSLRGQTGLNLSLRNAASQLQMDLANAGTGYFQTANVPSWPVGVTIVNHWVSSGSSCYSGGVYGASCFDQLNIIAAANPATYPPASATDSTGGTSPTTNCSDTSTGNAYVVPTAASGFTLAQTAAQYVVGDQLLFLNAAGSKITSVVLTAAPSSNGAAVKLVFAPTNGPSNNPLLTPGSNSLANDPLDITACDGTQPCTAGNKLSPQFCGGDWVLKLAPIIYQVDTTTASDPKLTRTQNGATATVMDQVIGFKVGATIWNGTTDTDVTAAATGAQYFYAASTYTNTVANDMAYNFTLVRSVRVSLIARTAPGTDPYTFKNSFDQGSYTVQGVAVVVNPRNMSMND